MNIKQIKKEIATAFGKCDIEAGYFAPLTNYLAHLRQLQSKELNEELGELLSEVTMALEDIK